MSSITLPVVGLVLHPDYQARAGGIMRDLVEDYATVLRDHPDTWPFPPITCLRVDDALIVVDGWHRVEAARTAGRETVEGVVSDGTQREAVIAAAQANAAHGARRTRADMRRAVAMCLCDEELCKLSNRKLAELIRVSHPYVGEIRGAYGVKPGELLSRRRVAEVDGDRPPEWEAAIRGLPSAWMHAEGDKIRLAPDVPALGALWSGNWAELHPLRQMRAAELAVHPWPWPEDRTAVGRIARATGLDTIADIERALASVDLEPTARHALYGVYSKATEALAEKYASNLRWHLRPDGPLAGRPRIRAMLEAQLARAEQIEAEKAQKNPWARWSAARDIKDGPAQVAALEALDEEALKYLRPSGLTAYALEKWLAPQYALTKVDCADPMCRGWAPTSTTACVICGRDQEGIRTTRARSLTDAAGLLGHPGYGLRVVLEGRAVTVDQTGARVLLELVSALEGATVIPAWLKKAPAALLEAIDVWARTAPPVETFPAPELVTAASTCPGSADGAPHACGQLRAECYMCAAYVLGASEAAEDEAPDVMPGPDAVTVALHVAEIDDSPDSRAAYLAGWEATAAGGRVAAK